MRKGKIIISFAICFVSLSSISQPAAIKTEYKGDQFLKWILLKQPEQFVDENPFQLKTDIIGTIKEKTIVSAKDSISICGQIEKNNKLFFNKNSLAGKKVLTDNEIKKLRDGVAYEFLKISPPVYFSGKVFILIERHCGEGCGSGEVQVFKVSGSLYKLLFQKRIWIS